MKGRIPNKAKNYVNELIEKYGFHLAYHYWTYNINFGKLSGNEANEQRAFDSYYKKHKEELQKSKFNINEMVLKAIEEEQKRRTSTNCISRSKLAYQQEKEN